MSGYRLTYFNFRGRAETARLILAQANIEYEDIRIQFEDWPTLKPKTQTGQLPILEVGDFKLSQSVSIARYLAHKHGLAGATPEESAKCDMLVDFMQDILPELIPIYKAQTEDEKETLRKKFLKEKVSTFYGTLEKMLVENKEGNGYFVGDGVTWADLHFINFLDWPSPVGIAVDMSSYPKLKALGHKVRTLPRIASWISKRPQTSR